MEEKPEISVVLPYYNAAKSLDTAIQSILNQTFTDFELILVNNRSTDDGPGIAARYEIDQRVKFVEEPQKGIVHALNSGLKHVRGRYVARMDADDFSYPDRLMKQHAMLESHPSIGVVSGLVTYSGAEENQGLKVFVDWVNSLQSPQAIALSRFIESPVVHPSVMIRKSVFDQYGHYRDGDFPEDYDLWLRWMESGVQFSKVPVPVVRWEDSESRLSRTDSRCSQEAFYKIKAHYLAKWLKKHNNQPVWVWGAGKLSRKRVRFLEAQQISIAGYFDVKEKQVGEVVCKHFEDIPAPGQVFILSYVGNRGIRDEIRQFLKAKGYREGYDFLLAA